MNVIGAFLIVLVIELVFPLIYNEKLSPGIPTILFLLILNRMDTQDTFKEIVRKLDETKRSNY